MLLIPELYIKAIKYGYETKELGLLVAHMAFNNLEFSKKIAKKLLTGINRANGDDIEPCLNVLEPYLLLNDSYKQ